MTTCCDLGICGPNSSTHWEVDQDGKPKEPGCVVCGKPRHAIDILGERWCFSCYWQEMADPPGSEVIG